MSDWMKILYLNWLTDKIYYYHASGCTFWGWSMYNKLDKMDKDKQMDSLEGMIDERYS